MALVLSVAFARAGDSPAELASVASTAKPDFRLDDLSQKQVSLAAQRGQVVLVHFFATWCEPCREEMAGLKRLVERAEKTPVRVLAVSVAEVDIRVRNYFEKGPVNFPVLLDRDRAVAKSWGVSALPTTFILDRNLKPRLVVERDYEWDRLDISALLASLSARQASSPPLTAFAMKTKLQGENE